MNIISGQRRIGPFNFDFLYDDDHGDNHRTIRVSDGTGWSVETPAFGKGDEVFRNHCISALIMARTRLKDYHHELFDKFRELALANGASEQAISLSFHYEPGERGAYSA